MSVSFSIRYVDSVRRTRSWITYGTFPSRFRVATVSPAQRSDNQSRRDRRKRYFRRRTAIDANVRRHRLRTVTERTRRAHTCRLPTNRHGAENAGKYTRNVRGYASVCDVFSFFPSESDGFRWQTTRHTFSRIGFAFRTWATAFDSRSRRHGVQRRVHAAKPTFSVPRSFVRFNPVVNRLFHVECKRRTDVCVCNAHRFRNPSKNARPPHSSNKKTRRSVNVLFFFQLAPPLPSSPPVRRRRAHQKRPTAEYRTRNILF